MSNKKRKYTVTGTNVDENGLKTTITVKTDDENVVKKLLDNNSNTMNAEFKEVKKKPKKANKVLTAPKQKKSNKKVENKNGKKKHN